MKRLLRSLLLAAVLTAALCVGALAAEPTAAGIYAVTGGNGVTLTPQTAGQSVITAETQESYGAYYANAVRFGVEKDNLTVGAQYLLLVVKGRTEAPSEKNIVYIDQQAADSNGKVSFNAYPSSLTKDDYRVYVVGDGSAYSQGTPTASFRYYQPYTLGDVNGDNEIDVQDAAAILNHVVMNDILTGSRYEAANVEKDDVVDVRDAAKLMNFIVKNITSLE